MPLTELSRNQIIQKRKEVEKSTSFTPILEPEKRPVKKKEKSIFAPDDEAEAATDEN